MQWNNFKHDGKTYDLSHLHPRSFRFERPAEGGRPAEIYTVDTVFTSQCFTRDPKKAETYDASLIYPDPYEVRIFDPRRYEMSKHLATIIQALPMARPRHNGGRGKFFSVEMITESGDTVEYDIFFKVKKGEKGLEMIIETAFIRDPDYDSARPDGKPIRFWIILHHTLHNIKIRT